MSPVRLDAHDREHDGAVGHAEALHPRPGQDVIAPEPHGAGEIRDADATRVEERQILAALPRRDEDVGPPQTRVVNVAWRSGAEPPRQSARPPRPITINRRITGPDDSLIVRLRTCTARTRTSHGRNRR